MKNLFFVLILSSLFAPLSLGHTAISDAQAQRQCEEQPTKLNIRFTTSYGTLVYDRSKTKAELSIMAQRAGIFEKGVFAAGLALVNIDSEYELNTLTQTLPNNGHCLVPYQLNVHVGYSRPIIYLAKELEQGSCTYNLVLRHEQVHQQINKQALEYFVPQIYQTIKAQASQIKSIYIAPQASEDKAAQELTQKYHQIITPLVDNFRDQILAEQSKLDNQNQYRLEGDICRQFNRKSRS